MTTVNLSHNLLSSLPANLPLLTHITKLDLSKNQLTDLPENFGQLRALKSLDLYANRNNNISLRTNRTLILPHPRYVANVKSSLLSGGTSNGRQEYYYYRNYINRFFSTEFQYADFFPTRSFLLKFCGKNLFICFL